MKVFNKLKKNKVGGGARRCPYGVALLATGGGVGSAARSAASCSHLRRPKGGGDGPHGERYINNIEKS